MKKNIFITLIVILTGMMSAQSLNVTRPSAADHWRAGSSKNITWNTTAPPERFVKIRLYNEAGVRTISITDRTENDGSFRWRIPATLSPGTYVVRVREVRNNFSDDSAPFRILEARTLIVATEMNYETKFKKDIEVADIWVKDNCKIWVKYKNNGVLKIDHVFKTEIWVNGIMVENAGHHIIINPGLWFQHEISVAGNASRFVAKKIKVVVDTENTYKESNESNNVLEKKVKCKSPFVK